MDIKKDYCIPKPNPLCDKRFLQIGRYIYAKTSENTDSCCYSISGAVSRKRKKTKTTPCPKICIVGAKDSEGGETTPCPQPASTQILKDAQRPANIPEAYKNKFKASGGTSPYTYVDLYGTMPPGITITNAVTGDVGGLPGAGTGGNTYTFTIKATDVNGCTGEQVFSIFVNNIS